MSRTERLIGNKIYKILDLSVGVWQRHGFNVTVLTDETRKCQVICSAVVEGTVLRVVPKFAVKEVELIKIYTKNNAVYIYANWNKDTNYIAFIDSNSYIVDVGYLDDSYNEISVV